MILRVLFFISLLSSAGASTIRFELPIDWVSQTQYDLEVIIPEGYSSLQDFKDWEKATLIEFVPEGENGDNWSEIITIQKFIGQKIQADILVNLFKEKMLADVTNGKVWVDTQEKIQGYQKATLFLSYDYERRHEVMGGQYFSGPFDCVGVQYSIRSGDNEKAISKIANYFKESTRVKKKPLE